MRVMWMLEIALCPQLAAGVIECRSEVQGPYVAPMACRERMNGQRDALRALADDLDAELVDIKVGCRRGRDA
ncbi:hypothetical protein NBRC116593_28730 [Sulfitobacter pacificus]